MNKEYAGAIKRIAYGYIICFFDINIGTLNLLPDWLGILMIYQSLTPISKYDKSVKLLDSTIMIIFIYEAFNWLLTIFTLEINIYVINVIFRIISLYFHFQLITNIADIAREHHYNKYKTLLISRTLKAVSITISALPISWEMFSFGMLIYTLVTFFIEGCIIYYLFNYASFEENVKIIEGS